LFKQHGDAADRGQVQPAVFRRASWSWPGEQQQQQQQ
jgi:hypothetical protein